MFWWSPLKSWQSPIQKLWMVQSLISTWHQKIAHSKLLYCWQKCVLLFLRESSIFCDIFHMTSKCTSRPLCDLLVLLVPPQCCPLPPSEPPWSAPWLIPVCRREKLTIFMYIAHAVHVCSVIIDMSKTWSYAMKTIWGSQGTEDLKVSRPQSNTVHNGCWWVYRSITKPAFPHIWYYGERWLFHVSSYVDGLVLI